MCSLQDVVAIETEEVKVSIMFSLFLYLLVLRGLADGTGNETEGRFKISEFCRIITNTSLFEGSALYKNLIY